MCVKISVAMTTYNGEKVLAEQLDSIFSQSMLPDEIVICDDGSTDNTLNILKKYAREYSMIRFFQNDNNLGFIKNFEKAVSLCRGEFILLSDQDDIWSEDHIKVLMDHAKNAEVVCANAEYISEDGICTGRTMKPAAFRQTGDIRTDVRSMLFTSYTQGATMLIKKAILSKVMPFPEDVFHDIWLGFSTYAVGGRVRYVPNVILYYR